MVCPKTSPILMRAKPNEVRVGYVGSVNPGVQHRIAENGEIRGQKPCPNDWLLSKCPTKWPRK
jgi:hypothetical protein